MMHALSSLGDAALLLPASLILLAYLGVSRQLAAAAIWGVALVACGIATIAAKLLFHTCGAALSDLDIVSPSGHASLASVFYGSLGILVASGRPRWQRAIFGISAVALLGLIGLSRVRTGAHSPEEVVLGLVIGGLCVALFAALHRKRVVPPVSPVPLTLGFLVALAVLGGRHFTLEPIIGGLARRISAVLDVCMDAPSRQAILLQQR
jgi:membrane-associated phospholipid phosphatase